MVIHAAQGIEADAHQVDCHAGGILEYPDLAVWIEVPMDGDLHHAVTVPSGDEKHLHVKGPAGHGLGGGRDGGRPGRENT